MSDGSETRVKGDEYICPECNRKVTVGSNGVEYGHSRGRYKSEYAERCPRRPDCVDPCPTGDGRNRYEHIGGVTDD